MNAFIWLALILMLMILGCDHQQTVFSSSRDAIRAYYGAPPVIPHPVLELGRGNCLACHEQGLKPTEGPVAVAKPHPILGDCRQCHLEQHSDVKLISQNMFLGLAESHGTTAAYPGAPPVIPHRIWLRENCLACHGPRGHLQIQTTHPERFNCLQCHAPQDSAATPLVENLFAARGVPRP